MGNKILSQIPISNLYLMNKNIFVQKQIKDIPRKVKDYHYCKSHPKIRNQPKLIGLSKPLVQQLGLNYEQIKNNQQTAFYLSGSKLLTNSQPICNNYCGYQFGQWAGQLGDGRAHTIGHLILNSTNNRSLLILCAYVF